jgi:hypothetical protein
MGQGRSARAAGSYHAGKTKQALALVKEAKTVTLQINPFKKTGMDTGGFGENVHRMAGLIQETGAVRGALDIIQLSIRDGRFAPRCAVPLSGSDRAQAQRAGGELQRLSLPLTAAGCRESAADRMGPGYITRAILVDMPLLKQVKWLAPSTPIYVRDLGPGRNSPGLHWGGDALLIRSGRWAKRAADGPWAYGGGWREACMRRCCRGCVRGMCRCWE